MESFHSHLNIDPDTLFGYWVPCCIPILQGNGGGINIVPFYPCGALFGYIWLFLG